jgi:hypothetical protein
MTAATVVPVDGTKTASVGSAWARNARSSLLALMNSKATGESARASLTSACLSQLHMRFGALPNSWASLLKRGRTPGAGARDTEVPGEPSPHFTSSHHHQHSLHPLPQTAAFNDYGEGGIRTLDTLSGTHAFQACAFSHSATSPELDTSGQSRIRTYGTVAGTPDFESGAFDHSAICPKAIYFSTVLHLTGHSPATRVRRSCLKNALNRCPDCSASTPAVISTR